MKKLGGAPKRLYFAKVDVTSCFDTLPQDQLLKLAADMLSAEEYNVARHAELKPSSLHLRRCEMSANKLLRRYRAVASDAKSFKSFETMIEGQVKNQRPNSIFNDAVVRQTVKKQNALELIRQHVTENVVKIGKKFFRQKQGISQGSVLSSILCNICYAEFEKEELAFVNDGESLLMRLIDDFLLITTSRNKCAHFLETMHEGNAAYGLTVKPEKSLTNIDVSINGETVRRVGKREPFPYCGMRISCDTLDIIKEGPHHEVQGRSRWLGNAISEVKLTTIDIPDSLTVEYSRLPGQSFRRKMTRSALVSPCVPIVFRTRKY